MHSYRNSGLRFAIILTVLLAALVLIIDYGTSDTRSGPSGEPVTDSLVTAAYPELYEAVFERDPKGIHPFLDHPSKTVRKQAWRALANTPLEDIDPYIEQALDQNSPASWFAVSMQPLDGTTLRKLESEWGEREDHRAGICRVLGRQGDENSLRFLFAHFGDITESSYEYACALAIGRLLLQHNIGEPNLIKIIRRAFNADNPDITRAYLYGLYRGDVQELTEAAENVLYSVWGFYDIGTYARVDQYVVRLLQERAFRDVTLFYNSDKILNNNVQVALELANVVEEIELDQQARLPVKVLLTHENPHVVRRTLQGLDGRVKPGESLYDYIRNELVENDDAAPSVWLQALMTAGRVDSALIARHRDRLRAIRSEYPYLLPEVLGVLRVEMEPGEFVTEIAEIVDTGDPLRSLFAVRALNDFWSDAGDVHPDEGMEQSIRGVVLDALSLRDRGVAFALQGLLSDGRLFGPRDFNRINEALSSFDLPEDIEVYQAFGRLYRQNFEQQAKPVIDSLAGLDYPPLNRSLRQAGWEVAIPETAETEFRRPDWNRLWSMGATPVWVLRTEKGDIRIRLDLLSAPATVSAIDSLTRAGAYDGVPFHRVVPNFVIQGGDMERGDGFGGPDFVLPTEGSELEYTRGSVGIASAGTDTEGSQYFIMHQWKPHLNGSYTRFGEVIEGMDVVDRIVEGDSVRVAYWE